MSEKPHTAYEVLVQGLHQESTFTLEDAKASFARYVTHAKAGERIELRSVAIIPMDETTK